VHDVHMAKLGMPMPRVLPGDRVQTNWARNVDVEHYSLPGL
jgi:hypothetical protein